MKRLNFDNLNYSVKLNSSRLTLKKKNVFSYLQNWKTLSYSSFIKMHSPKRGNPGYFKKLYLKGIGFRSFTIKQAESGHFLLLDLGYSHYIFVAIPLSIRILTRKYDIFFYSSSLAELNNYLAHLIKLRKPDMYKGKGVHYEGQVITYKKGKQR